MSTITQHLNGRERTLRRLPANGASACRALAVLGGTVLVGLTATGTARAAEVAPVCRSVQIPVSVQDGGVNDQHLFGRLCRPGDEFPKVAQLLVHGLGYTADYWTGHGDSRSDYEAYMLRAGYATLAVDRLGIDRSSHPPSSQITFEAHESTLKQAAAWLHGPASFGADHVPAKVVLVGHSYGTVTGRAVAATSPDIDGFAATAHAHLADAAKVVTALPTCARPAQTDPVTRDQVPALDLGYMTTAPGCRAQLFFDTNDATPQAIAADEAAKSTVTAAEVLSIVRAERNGDGFAKRIVAKPVLSTVGQNDAIFCGPAATDCSSSTSLFRAERSNYASADLAAYVQPNSGHNINLHKIAPTFFGAVECWLAVKFPSSRSSTASCGSADIVDGTGRPFGRSTPSAPSTPTPAGKRCLPRKLTVTKNAIGPARIGRSRDALLGRGATAAGSRALRFCVVGGGSVRIALDTRGRALLIATTAAGHRSGRLHPGSTRRAYARRYPGARRLGAGLTQVAPGDRLRVGVRAGRLRFLAIAPSKLTARQVRTALRTAGLKTL